MYNVDVSEMHQNEPILLVSAPPPPPPCTHVVREYRDFIGLVQPQALRFLTHRDHNIWKAFAASYFIRVTSSTSPSNEQSLRVFTIVQHQECFFCGVVCIWLL